MAYCAPSRPSAQPSIPAGSAATLNSAWTLRHNISMPNVLKLEKRAAVVAALT
jgi:hypothetical protein